VYNATLCLEANSLVAGRVPGTTTAPEGIVKGASGVFR